MEDNKETSSAEKSSWNWRISLRKEMEKFERLWGFKFENFKSYENLVKLLYRPTDAASLGISRALFGLCMVIDVVEERGLADIDLKWGDPYTCRFPLIHGMKPASLPYMIVIYSLMWIGAFGIMLGFCFKLASALFVIPYWYIFLLDKSLWNNHSYLYGIVGILFWASDANRYCALDAKLMRKPQVVPLWNYFILKFQFFALYFLAGLKKSSKEWLEGYSMMNLSTHWVFDPFKMFLTTEQIDFLIVHWFGFIFDLTVGFWLLFDKTRIPAMFLCASFHLMNSRLFTIGMFPYVCLATMGLFCHVDWPRKMVSFLRHSITFKGSNKMNQSKTENDDDKSQETSAYSAEKTIDKCQCKYSNDNEQDEKQVCTKPKKKQKVLVFFLLLHIFFQLFLPYSHFITKGYNNWVPGLYGYSWDMMIHSWDTILIVIRVHDNENNEDHFIDPQAWVQNDRWSKHGDMAIQYSQCLKNNLLKKKQEILNSGEIMRYKDEWSKLSDNLSIYIDVRCSLNGRFQQRVFNPNVDLLTVNWSPFKPVSFLMPLLTQYNSYRQKMEEITQDIYTWSNYTDVLFIADYSGGQMENYFNNDFSNVSLTVLEGEVIYSEENSSYNITINKYQSSIPVPIETLHRIVTISTDPACYMYTYKNQTRETFHMNGISEPPMRRIGFPILEELKYKISAWWRAFNHILEAFFYLAYDVPILRRVPHQFHYHDDYYL